MSSSYCDLKGLSRPKPFIDRDCPPTETVHRPRLSIDRGRSSNETVHRPKQFIDRGCSSTATVYRPRPFIHRDFLFFAPELERSQLTYTAQNLGVNQTIRRVTWIWKVSINLDCSDSWGKLKKSSRYLDLKGLSWPRPFIDRDLSSTETIHWPRPSSTETWIWKA